MRQSSKLALIFFLTNIDYRSINFRIIRFNVTPCKPFVSVVGDAGMKKLDLATDGFGDASPTGCFGSLIASFGSFSSVIFCFLRLKNTSAPLNVGEVWSTDFSNFSEKFGRWQSYKIIFSREIKKKFSFNCLLKDKCKEK